MRTIDRVEFDPASEKRALVLFFALAYAIAWLFFIPLALSRAGLAWLPVDLSIGLMTVFGTLGPSLAALLTLRITEKRWPAIRAWPDTGRALLGVVLGPVLIAAAFAALPAMALSTGPWSQIHWGVLLSGSVYNLSTILGGPLFEEPGWRGFALPRLQSMIGPVRASLILGILWASWHLPLFLCKSWTSTSLPNYYLILTGLSFLLTFLYNVSGGSVVATIVAHAAFNTVARWLGGLLDGVPARDTPSAELIIGLAGWVTAVLLLVVTRGRLGWRTRT